jgi:tetratricopeptide (TPR) repeat protein
MVRLSEAEGNHRAALALREKLAAEFPSVPQHQVDLGGSYCNLGNVLVQSGRTADALASFDKAIATLTAVFERDPRSISARQFLRNSFEGRARAYDRLEKPAEAEKDWAKAIELAPTRDQRRLQAARAVTRAHSEKIAEAIAEIADFAKDSRWNAPQWYEYADRAMELLAKAVGEGFRDLDLIKSDVDLNSLRQRDDFKRLVKEVEAATAAGKIEKP